MLLLVPMALLSSRIPEEIEELINSHLLLRSQGVDLNGPEESEEAQYEGYELIERREKKEYFEDLFRNRIGHLYLRLEKCNEASLVFFSLMEFNSLLEMDRRVAEG